MASNSHRKRRSPLAAPTEGSPLKRTKVSNQTHKKNQTACQRLSGFCRLGLRRILDSNGSSSKQSSSQELGPLIRLCPKMYLGRTPPTLTKAMEKAKSLNKTWTTEDFDSFYSNQSIARKHALLGIDRDSSISGREDEILRSVSRMLLRVLHSQELTASTILLQRGPEAVTSNGNRAQQIPVSVYRKPKQISGVENEQTNCSNSVDVCPDAKVLLREGDTLMILNENYRYKVVDTAPAICTNVANTKEAAAIQLLETSSSSSSEDLVSPSPFRSPKSSTGRQSLSSMNDHTIHLPDKDFEKNIRTALRMSLEESRKKNTPNKNSQEVIQIDSTSNSEDEKPKSQAPQAINLAEASASSDNSDKDVTAKTKTINIHDNNNSIPVRRSSRNRRPILSEVGEIPTEQSIGEKTNEKEIVETKRQSSRLRQTGLRIKHVLMEMENEEGILVEKPIQEVIREQKIKKQAKQKASKPQVTITGPTYSTEEPTKRFWDLAWSTDGEAVDGNIITNDLPSKPHTKIHSTSTSDSQLPNPCDIPASDGTLYWNSLNSSRPREGAWYLHSNLIAANAIPGPLLCEKWMNLLTWGPKSQTWDGPRMDYALDIWKQALRRHPRVLLKRMIVAAPGGISEWWKTCLSYDDLAEKDTAGKVQNKSQEATIQRLRTKSLRFEAFLYLLKSNLALEKRVLHSDRERATNNHKNGGIDMGNESCSDEEEEEENDTAILLGEIRSIGRKPVLRLVAQAISKFWISQRNYLGYMEEEEAFDPDCLELVQGLSRQLAEILGVMRKILELPPEQPHRQRRRKASTDMSNVDIRDILWNSMDLEVRERLPKAGKSRNEKEAFLVDWICTLRESMGNEFARQLAEKVGVAKQYGDLWEL